MQTVNLDACTFDLMIYFFLRKNNVYIYLRQEFTFNLIFSV